MKKEDKILLEQGVPLIIAGLILILAELLAVILYISGEWTLLKLLVTICSILPLGIFMFGAGVFFILRANSKKNEDGN